jgi:hypothetical protein
MNWYVIDRYFSVVCIMSFLDLNRLQCNIYLCLPGASILTTQVETDTKSRGMDTFTGHVLPGEVLDLENIYDV